jgi:hypothetical protein
MAHRLVDVAHDEAHLPKWTKKAAHGDSSYLPRYRSSAYPVVDIPGKCLSST